MDKIKINNQVVCMRKFVKQGKIRIINKCVKEIQLLRNRKGGEQKIAKCQRKADRLLEEVAILKKIKPDNVSRMALTKSKDWKAVLSEKGVSPEDRCFALLASYGPVQEEVDKFYSENSYLTLKIPTLIQEWEEKNSNLTPLKNQNSFKMNRKANEVRSKNDPSHTAKENNKSIKVKSGKKSTETRKQSVMLNDDNRSTLKVRGSEDMMVDDSEDEGSKDTKRGHCEVSNRNNEDNEEESNDNQANSNDGDSDGSDENDGDSDGNVENSDENEEDSDGNVENSEDNEEGSDDQEGSDESDMHSDDDEKEEENSRDNDLKNKSEASSIKKSKMKSKPAKKDSNIRLLSPVKTASDFKNKIPSLQKNVPLETNSTKAVAMVNLNELMDMDEIPIVSSKTDEKQASELKKRKKDSFFLKDGEEEFSESDHSKEEDSDNDEDGTFNHKNVRSNNFNKKSSFAQHGRTKMEDNSRNFKNKGFSNNAPHGKKFEKDDQKFRNDSHFKQKFNRFDKNDRKPYSEPQKFNRFDKNDRKPYSEPQNFNRFNKNDAKPYSDQQNFKKNKWNRGDESDRKGSKPFSNFQEKKQAYSKNKPNNAPRNDFGKTVKKDEPPLHPSWEAKRKLKQATNTKFQGKRMVFDD